MVAVASVSGTEKKIVREIHNGIVRMRIAITTWTIRSTQTLANVLKREAWNDNLS